MAHLHCQMCGLEKRVSSKFEGVVVKCPNCGDKVLVGSSELSASNEPEDTESTTGEVWNGEPPLPSRNSPTRERNRNAIIYAISGTLVLGSFLWAVWPEGKQPSDSPAEKPSSTNADKEASKVAGQAVSPQLKPDAPPSILDQQGIAQPDRKSFADQTRALAPLLYKDARHARDIFVSAGATDVGGVAAIMNEKTGTSIWLKYSGDTVKAILVQRQMPAPDKESIEDAMSIADQWATSLDQADDFSRPEGWDAPSGWRQAVQKAELIQDGQTIGEQLLIGATQLETLFNHRNSSVMISVSAEDGTCFVQAIVAP